MILCYLSPITPPKQFSFLAVLSLAYPIIFVLNVLFIVLWLSFKKWLFLLSGICLLIGWNLHGRFIQLSNGSNQEQTEESHSIMTYNMRWLHHVPPYQDGKRDEKIQNLAKKLADEKISPDFLCIQEGAAADELGQLINLKHHVSAPRSSIWFLSRYPIDMSGFLTSQHTGLPYAIWANVNIDGRIVRIYTLYLQSNRITQEANQLMDDIRIQEKSTWIKLQDILTRYRSATKRRSEQAVELKTHISESPYPVIIGGDFNDIPYSHAYNQLSQEFCDSFMERGSGLGTSYAGNLPALRIDYVLTPKSFAINTHEVLDWDYSDHYPVYVEFTAH